MTSRKDYTTPEWNTLQSAIVGASFYIRELTPGFFDRLKIKYATDRLIDKLEDSSQDEFFKELLSLDDFKTRVPKFVPRDYEAIKVPVLQAVDASLGILHAKDPSKIEPFERLVLEIAQAAADDIDGISPPEQAAINEIIEVLSGKLQVASAEDVVNAYSID